MIAFPDTCVGVKDSDRGAWDVSEVSACSVQQPSGGDHVPPSPRNQHMSQGDTQSHLNTGGL